MGGTLVMERKFKLPKIEEINERNCVSFVEGVNDIEMKLDEADRQAAMTDERLSHETVFKNVRRAILGK